MYRLSYERRGDISFIARETISYFVTSERSERGTKYDIVTRAIKLILPSLEHIKYVTMLAKVIVIASRKRIPVRSDRCLMFSCYGVILLVT